MIGMAVSVDGIHWNKFNDPLTTEHPFTDSDPVLTEGSPEDWDGGFVWMANVTNSPEGFRMYYTGEKDKISAIGYAESKDGIRWTRDPGNPVFHGQDDHINIENPSLLCLDTICFLYYNQSIPKAMIAVATVLK
ncbi:MAG: hypothetical protein Q8M08_13920 [Bacteroidales bacterium]|nr:hypothetical protein [Bacteroidales bacterium]